VLAALPCYLASASRLAGARWRELALSLRCRARGRNGHGNPRATTPALGPRHGDRDGRDQGDDDRRHTRGGEVDSSPTRSAVQGVRSIAGSYAPDCGRKAGTGTMCSKPESQLRRSGLMVTAIRRVAARARRSLLTSTARWRRHNWSAHSLSSSVDAGASARVVDRGSRSRLARRSRPAASWIRCRGARPPGRADAYPPPSRRRRHTRAESASQSAA
jgi:hypothetical protein